MKPNAQGWVLFGTSTPAVILGYLAYALSVALFLTDVKSTRMQGAGVVTAKSRGWVADRFGYSITIGRFILYHPRVFDDTVEIDGRVEKHEFVHIRQWEDAVMWGLVGGGIGALLGVWLVDLSAMQALGMWWISWALSVATMLTNFITAVLREGWKGIYRDTEHERSAYAQTDVIRLLRQHGDYRSWEEMRDEARGLQEGLLR